MVCDMLCKYYESNWNVSNCDSCNVGPAEILNPLNSLEKGEFGNCNKGVYGNTVCNQCLEGSEIDDLESIDACRITDTGQHQSNHVTD